MSQTKRRRSLSSLIQTWIRFKSIARRRKQRALRRAEIRTVPSEFTGKWVAWGPNGRTIVASGDSPGTVKLAAEEGGYLNDVRYEWIPHQNELRSVLRTEATGSS